MIKETREDGVMVAVAGVSRSGKSWRVKKTVAGAPRALVWDIRGEYHDEGFTIIKTIPELAAALGDHARTKGRFAYWGEIADFSDFCRLAYLWAQLWPSVIVADEIADVTNPGKAPDQWGRLIRKGLYYGAHIYSITQRPQECDKSVWGNATYLQCFRMLSPKDRAYMADRLSVNPAEIESLEPYHYIERRQGADNIRHGTPAD